MRWPGCSCSIRGIDFFFLTPAAAQSIKLIVLNTTDAVRNGGSMFSKTLLFFFCVSFLMIRPGPAFSQARDTASLFGTITDAQGAAVPGARLTVINTATSQSRNTTTDGVGGFTFPLLPVGTYTLTVEQTGFRKYERKGILLQANENVNVSPTLELGNVQETVTVEARGPIIETPPATLSNTVDS